MNFGINFMAVLAAGFVSMAIGFVWYGPLFEKKWMQLTGRTKESMKKEKANMPAIMGTMFASALVTAFVLAVFVNFVGATDAISGAMVGFWAWAGFMMTLVIQDVLYEKKNRQLAAITLGYNLVTLLVNGALLAVWV